MEAMKKLSIISSSSCIAAKQKASILSRHNREGNTNKYCFYRGGDSYCSKVKDIFCQA